MDKLQELKKRIEEVQAKSAVSGEIRAFITLVLKIIKETKDNFDTLSKENLATISEALKYIEQEHEKVINSVSHETKEVKLDFAKQVKELKDLAEQVKAIKPKDGADGKDADEAVIVENVLAKIKLPEYEVFTLEDKGAEIVDEINALPLEDAYKIDASHIKNLPPTIIQGGNISKAVYQLSDVVLTNLTNDEVLKWDATNQVWINGTGGGGGTWGSITGTLSDQTDLQSALDAKQATLVSATNIKTINGNSLLGSGDLVITGTIDGSGTTNELTYWVDSDTVGSLAVATYPSLTELTYIKGVTSAIQTQLNAKASSTAYTLAGVSALSDDATKSLYTMSAGVPVEFESSDNNTLLYLDETNERVGIGTTSPTARTHIVGSGSTSSTTALLVENSIGTDGLVVTGDSYVTVPNGRLGVGTSSPDGRMHIAESIVSGGASAFNSTITIENNDSHGINIISPTSRSGNIYFSDNVASRGQIGYNHNGDYMYFHTAGSERIRIDGAGAVGIGTTTPTAKLDVVGSGSTSATTAFRVANSVGTDALEIKDNGISTFNNRVYQTGLGESTFFGFEA
ncbi:hypothetical protein K9M47_03055, partial [Candidatus Gracilibacteria bacterium]|nr:hypothetical protein [Candidatus Gracilibacteria bacterium]